jgi:alpha-acetolactate decarboxylase
MVGAVTTGAAVIVGITVAGAMAGAATTVAGRAFPDAEDSKVVTVAVIPAEADVPLAEAVIFMAVAATAADAHLTAADIAMEAETHIMAVDAAMAVADKATTEEAVVDTPLTEEDTASVAAVDMAPVAAVPTEEVAGMAVGTGNLDS